MPYVSGFSPSASGLHFFNIFASVPLFTVEIIGMQVPIGDASNGMCGGMVFAVRDYFEVGITPPPDMTAPSSGPLFDHIVRRLFDSFNLLNLPPGPTRYMYLMNPTLPDHETWASSVGLLPHGRAWVMVREEWPRIRADIDANRLSPIGLVRIKTLDPFQMGHNHQVLVYGYDLTDNQLVLHVYDPNEPDLDDVTLSLDIGNPEHTTAVISSHPDAEYPNVFCFFRIDYSPVVPPPQANGTVEGRVFDAVSGQPLVGATVTAAGAIVATDAAGRYSLNLPPRSYSVSAWKAGYSSASASVRVIATTTVTQNFSLGVAAPPAYGSIAGTVKDTDGDPIEGARVSSRGVTATTGIAGDYLLSRVLAGATTVSAHAAGYRRASKRATVVANRTTTVDLVLSGYIDRNQDEASAA